MNKKQVLEFCTVENLKREIKIQRKLQHTHVTKLFHYFEDKENVYLVLEYAGIPKGYFILQKMGVSSIFYETEGDFLRMKPSSISFKHVLESTTFIKEISFIEISR
jgi:serine/threonine protein kinase